MGFQEWRLRHDFAVYEIFAGVRMGEMFDIIRDFPDSLPAVQELRAALEITQQVDIYTHTHR
jgi:anaphase-promoting complex subunit 2